MPPLQLDCSIKCGPYTRFATSKLEFCFVVVQVLGSRRLKPVLLRANNARLLYNLVARVIPNILYLITPLGKEVLNVNKLFVGLDLSLKDYKVSIIDQN
ncbi:hypothetical protein JOD02_002303 [Caldicoprobacter guelmensis]|nr:hypothetical protein [Caldicoprobacter guelmensis]